MSVRFRRSLRGRLSDLAVLDGSDQVIATMTEEATTLVLEREPGLTDPVRALAVAAPLLVECFVGSDAFGPDFDLDD